MAKFWFISDTHNQHKNLKIPKDIDVVVHSGDFTDESTWEEIESFLDWFNELDIKHKILVPGNHDYEFFEEKKNPNRKLYFDSLNIHILQDSSVNIDGLVIWGVTHSIAPWMITKPVDLLISHYPPLSILDRVPPNSKFNPTNKDFHLGNKYIYNLINLMEPRFHVFGHIHECGGLFEKNSMIDTVHLNAAVLDEYYKLVRNGLLLDIYKKEKKNV